MNTHTKTTTLNSSSERLREMLKNGAKWSSEGNGLCKEIQNATGVSYATAQKWLYSDSLPRTPDERQRVSEVLCVDLLYWEYGFTSSLNNQDKKVDIHDPLLHVKTANTVMSLLQEKSLEINKDITTEAIISIEMTAFKIAAETNQSEPDIKILESLIEIAINNRI